METTKVIKNTLYVNYTKTGTAVADDKVEDVIISKASLCNDEVSIHFDVSTENVIIAARCMKMTGQIKCNLVLMFENEIVPMNEYGVIINWPSGFCDYAEKWVTTLLRLQMEQYEKSKLKKLSDKTE